MKVGRKALIYAGLLAFMVAVTVGSVRTAAWIGQDSATPIPTATPTPPNLIPVDSKDMGQGRRLIVMCDALHGNLVYLDQSPVGDSVATVKDAC